MHTMSKQEYLEMLDRFLPDDARITTYSDNAGEYFLPDTNEFVLAGNMADDVPDDATHVLIIT